ncbi:hypothetical protein [Mobiluncus sp.]|uniref:HAD family hydrolase n=1 Tax=Mobiluncus sp. TaxID=47293 RepID=UPI002A91C90D|nr:hypothetical protein [Mobiluncus sp.]MDY6077447.1 hypothetical protein [Mobiluncus sp.]
MNEAKILEDFKPQTEFFIGIDSDGCAIDQMNIKHFECFTPAYIKAFDLQPISTLTRETAIYMNLFSIHRGINRWAGLDLLFDLLKQRPEVLESEVKLPEGRELHGFVTSGLPLSEAGIKQWAAQHPSEEIERSIRWGEIVNELVAWIVHNCAPFHGVREAMEAMQGKVDAMVVSAASLKMLNHEWEEHDLKRYMALIAGQEMGTKSQQLAEAAVGKYDADRILLLGDAPGDGHAAADNGVLWFPIRPGHEAESWQEFREVGLPRFLEGSFRGDYQDQLIADFNKLLPATPPWRTIP